jgi:hypothetical protein
MDAMVIAGWEKPALRGGDADAVSDGFGDRVNRETVRGSTPGTLPVLLWPPISLGAVSMLTLL